MPAKNIWETNINYPLISLAMAAQLWQVIADKYSQSHPESDFSSFRRLDLVVCLDFRIRFFGLDVVPFDSLASERSFFFAILRLRVRDFFLASFLLSLVLLSSDSILQDKH